MDTILEHGQDTSERCVQAEQTKLFLPRGTGHKQEGGFEEEEEVKGSNPRLVAKSQSNHFFFFFFFFFFFTPHMQSQSK